jgi:hypothetical protein
MSIQLTKSFTPIVWPAAPQDYTGNNNLAYYTEETVQRYVYGTRSITWDGKVFKYARSLGTLYAGLGAFNGAGVDVSTLINSNIAVAIVAGDRSVKITVAATEGYAGDGAVAEDELAGAYFVVGHGGTGTGETRTIIGNEAIASGGGTGMIYVDYPFQLAHAVGFSELPLNPYRYLIAESEVASVMGVPNVSVTTGYNFWIQTWGPCWCTPGGADSTPGDSVNDRMVYFVGDGSVNGGTYIAASESGKAYQPAGFIIDPTEVGTGCMPLVMLQISI